MTNEAFKTQLQDDVLPQMKRRLEFLEHDLATPRITKYVVAWVDGGNVLGLRFEGGGHSFSGNESTAQRYDTKLDARMDLNSILAVREIKDGHLEVMEWTDFALAQKAAIESVIDLLA